MVRGGALLLLVALGTSACGGPVPGERPRPGRAVVRSTPGPGTPVVIEVFGTPGTRFGGSYGETDAAKSVEGTVPARLTIEFHEAFSIALQKRGPDGELGMEVVVAGRPVNRISTTKPFGVVTYKHGIASR